MDPTTAKNAFRRGAFSVQKYEDVLTRRMMVEEDAVMKPARKYASR